MAITMNWKIDLRFLLPPLLNLLLFLLNNQLAYVDLFHKEDDDDHFFLFILALLSLLFATLFFLLTSIKLPIHVLTYPLVFKFGDFSGPLALALHASLLLHPLLFFIAYLICIAISPWFPKLVETVKWLWLSFYHDLLQAMPSFVLTSINLQQPPPPPIERGEEEGGDNFIVPLLLQEVSNDSSDTELGLA